jgi:hypothetical protein
MSAQVDSLRSWSHILFWLSVGLPLLGVFAGVARFYVDRAEKALSSAASQAELQSSEQELADLKKDTAPRRLTPEQKASIAKALDAAAPGSFTLVSRFMDDECRDFADQIAEVFEQHGWKITQNRTSLNDFKGFSLALVAIDSAPPEADIAVGALRQAGFDFKNQTIRPESVSGAMPPGFAIFVGKR